MDVTHMTFYLNDVSCTFSRKPKWLNYLLSLYVIQHLIQMNIFRDVNFFVIYTLYTQFLEQFVSQQKQCKESCT